MDVVTHGSYAAATTRTPGLAPQVRACSAVGAGVLLDDLGALRVQSGSDPRRETRRRAPRVRTAARPRNGPSERKNKVPGRHWRRPVNNRALTIR